jgi:hypothetical protein
MGESESPEPVPLRVWTRLSEKIGVDARRIDTCRMLEDIERDLRKEVDAAMVAKDYVVADRAIDELSFLVRMKGVACRR